jgi:hypothetical protein
MQGYSAQQPGHGYNAPPPKKGMSGCLIAVIVAGCLLLGTCGVFVVIGALAHKGADGSTGAADDSALPPWVTTVKDNCAKYKAAPNEIKKSAVYNDNEAVVKASSVAGMQGKLRRLRTSQGGGDVDITIRAGSLQFTANNIAKGSPVYQAATDMTEGQCVIFSAETLEAASLVEQSKVCDLDYFAHFTELKACPK